MSAFETPIFGNKKFSDLLKEIYDNQRTKNRQINLLIADLKPFITNATEAQSIIPMIKDYLDISIRNDEHLVKIAAVIQRAINNKQDDGASFLTDEEKDALLKEIQEIGKEQEKNTINESTKDDIKRTGI